MTANILNNSNFRIVKLLRESKSVKNNYPEEFEFEFSDYPGTDTIVDLSEIVDFDLDFLYRLTRLYRSCRKNGGRIILANTSHDGRNLLDSSGLSAILPSAPDFNEAVNMLNTLSKVS